MKNQRRSIIYIGKATNLRTRVRSYFHDDQAVKTRALMNRVAHIEYIMTNSVYEALLLECNLIKQWHPKYNIELKDGKSYPILRITAERYPRVFKTHTIVKDGSQYFGPYINAGNLSKLLDEILRVYPLRKCRGPVRPRPHPCLHYHIGRCSAACAGKTSHAEYMERIRSITAILAGDTARITEHLHMRIVAAVKERQFEKAGVFRDALMAIKIIEEGQHIIDFKNESIDYFGHATHSGKAIISIFKTRKGKLIATENYRIEDVVDVDEQAAQIIIQYYEKAHQTPEQLVISTAYLNDELGRYFRQEHNRTLQVRQAETERDRGLMRLVLKNARAALLSGRGILTGTRSGDGGGHGEYDFADRPFAAALDELQQTLELPEPPTHIEGFDIAHVGGRHTVAGMVVCRAGTMANSEYRRYRIGSLADGQVDDFEAMREVVARRYTRLLNENRPLPQLILVDGGIGQVRAAWEILKTLHIGTTPIVGIAKKNEELYVPHQSQPLILPRRSPALRLLQAVRDEAHRFATTYRAAQQRKEITQTALQSIAGIGARREALLYQRYDSLADMVAVSDEELATILKMGVDRAREVKAALHRLAKSNA